MVMDGRASASDVVLLVSGQIVVAFPPENVATLVIIVAL